MRTRKQQTVPRIVFVLLGGDGGGGMYRRREMRISINPTIDKKLISIGERKMGSDDVSGLFISASLAERRRLNPRMASAKVMIELWGEEASLRRSSCVPGVPCIGFFYFLL